MNIIFAGTPEFAVASLEKLINSGNQIAAVISAPDKPAGRGCKMKESEVTQFAKKVGLTVLCPENLSEPDFISKISTMKPDLLVVVAFRKLPGKLWSLPTHGTINLHASLLPQYRGAAPINRAIMNGEVETGLTTFFINDHIDCGEIIDNVRLPIGINETAGELHDRMKVAGAELLEKTVQAISEGNAVSHKQDDFIGTKHDALRPAPKLNKETARIKWHDDLWVVHNHIRGLSPYPGAWTEFISPEGKRHFVKIYRSEAIASPHNLTTGSIITDPIFHLKIAVNQGFIVPKVLQQAGKKQMDIAEFVRGFPVSEKWEC
ncbi:MAG: methionyl-tRNA formyltransferase [Bacteroidetes bacterium]|nr:methionyl-tRNA formyltransferase [Bacteroidota bacterium]MBU1717658.1 methionyl-tRNA formyltransferase [Bacteroidota bacterium]